MRVLIEREAAVAVVAKVQAASNRSATIPILQNLLLEAADGELRLTATNLDIQATAQTEATVERRGEITVPAAEFHEILRSLPTGGELSLSVDGLRLVIRCGRATFRLPTLPATDFPAFDIPPSETRFSIPALELLRLLAKTGFATNRGKDSRYQLKAVYLHALVVEGALWLRSVATDGQRLALAAWPAPAGCADGFKVLIPTATVNEVSRLLAGVTDDVELFSDGRKAAFVIGDMTLTSKLIDGGYPEYWRVIPPSAARSLTLDVGLLSGAIKRASILGQGNDFRSVALEFSEGFVSVKARDMLGGDAEEQVECPFEGDPTTFRFHAPQFLEALDQLEGRQLTLELGEPTDPVKFVDPLDPAAFSILMPLRA